jgi:hypothetical protein
MVLLALILSPGVLFAQTGQLVAPAERSTLERQLEGEILCTCGCRLPVGSCGMLNCPGHSSQTAKLKQFLAEGKDHDAVLAAFIKDFGSQAVLAAPVDKGFNRLAWFFPYLAAVVALIGIVFSARRWSRHATPAQAADAGVDAELNARLDDELKNLD